MLRKIIFVFGMLLLVLQGTVATTHADAPLAPLVVIGNGTAASCQSEDAANALSNAVAAGGTITFDCGPQPVVMPVNTNVTEETVVIDGGNLITLSGEDLRQIFLVTSSGNLTLHNISLVDGGNFGGAAVDVSSAQASASIYNSFLTSNDAGGENGGAIFNVGTLVIDHSSLGANNTTGRGGAIFNNGGNVTITHSTLINNEAMEGGAIYHSEGTIQITNSAIRSNRATDASAATQNLGGGVHIDVGAVTVVNSTFYDNRATGGGGIYTRGNELSLTNVTFNRNRADTGGALWNGGGTVEAKNTIFANSRNTDDTDVSLNCDGPSISSQGHNIVSDNSCVPNPSSVGDLLGTDPQLEMFINDNGGPTRSFMPLAGSPAIDYGQACPATDQRGYLRPIGPACDVGAVERGWVIFLAALQR